MPPKPIFEFETLAQASKILGIPVTTLNNRLKRNPAITREDFGKTPAPHTHHGLTHHPLFQTFKGMKSRCYNTNNAEYYAYGGKGVVICQEWLTNPALFVSWSENNGWYKGCGLTIDRIDNDGNYCPNNCRWITRQEQAHNTSKNIWIQCPDGIKRNIQQLSEWCGLGYTTLRSRLVSNPDIPFGKLIEPERRRHHVMPTFNGQTLKQLASTTGIPYKILHQRVCRHPNITYEQLIQPINTKKRNGRAHASKG